MSVHKLALSFPLHVLALPGYLSALGQLELAWKAFDGREAAFMMRLR